MHERTDLVLERTGLHLGHDPVGDRVRDRPAHIGPGGERSHRGDVPPGVADLVLRPRREPAERHEEAAEDDQYRREDSPNTDFPNTDSAHSSRKNPGRAP
ncbi:hypothetical protein GCM10023080_098250 [Streptomyces pseudoechinosporeus]